MPNISRLQFLYNSLDLDELEDELKRKEKRI